MSLTLKAIHAFKWSVLGEVVSKAVGPLVFLVLARLLVPEDFGVVAAAMVIISFSQVFSDAGLGKALIQRQNRVEESANVVFWLNLGIGLVIVAILIAAAPLIAGFFHDERIAPVVRVLSLQILLAAFSSVHTALLQKDLNFKQLFWVRLATTAVPGLASIPLAIYGMGYWALVAGTLVGQAVQGAVLWRLSPWRPQWSFTRDLAGEIVVFGRWVMLSGLLGWFYVWMDTIVVGHYLGPHDMGLYRTGSTFVTMIFGLVFSPLLPVLYSLFSCAQHDVQRLRDTLMIVVHATGLISFPIGLGLFAFRYQIEGGGFGGNWVGIGMVIGMLGLTHGVGWLVGASGEVFRAIGRPQIETLVMVSMIAVYLLGYIVAIQYGLVVFLIVRFFLVCISLLPHLIFLRQTISFSITGFLKGIQVSLPAAAIAYLGVLLTKNHLGQSPFATILSVMLGVSMYVVFALLFERDFFCQLLRLRQSGNDNDGEMQ